MDEDDPEYVRALRSANDHGAAIRVEIEKRMSTMRSILDASRSRGAAMAVFATALFDEASKATDLRQALAEMCSEFGMALVMLAEHVEPELDAVPLPAPSISDDPVTAVKRAFADKEMAEWRRKIPVLMPGIRLLIASRKTVGTAMAALSVSLHETWPETDWEVCNMMASALVMLAEATPE